MYVQFLMICMSVHKGLIYFSFVGFCHLRTFSIYFLFSLSLPTFRIWPRVIFLPKIQINVEKSHHWWHNNKSIKDIALHFIRSLQNCSVGRNTIGIIVWISEENSLKATKTNILLNNKLVFNYFLGKPRIYLKKTSFNYCFALLPTSYFLEKIKGLEPSVHHFEGIIINKNWIKIVFFWKMESAQTQ